MLETRSASMIRYMFTGIKVVFKEVANRSWALSLEACGTTCGYNFALTPIKSFISRPVAKGSYSSQNEVNAWAYGCFKK
jgi:hypothetical protein